MSRCHRGDVENPREWKRSPDGRGLRQLREDFHPFAGSRAGIVDEKRGRRGSRGRGCSEGEAANHRLIWGGGALCSRPRAQQDSWAPAALSDYPGCSSEGSSAPPPPASNLPGWLAHVTVADESEPALVSGAVRGARWPVAASGQSKPRSVAGMFFHAGLHL